MSSDSTTAEETPWWRNAVVYQVYLRSFADGNGDGTGDIAGLRSRLDYLHTLGVDAIWINPWYQSPLADGGYDVSDYRQIDDRYGTIAEAELLISEAKGRDIRVIVDMVPNHTSEQHRWFTEAKAAPIGDPSRSRYHIMAGRGPDGSKPPTDWTSIFGGPAWTRLDDGEWYLHIFASEQPDLNWTHPEVRQEFESVLRFWLDLDVDGFRIDVAHGLVKDPEFPDLGDEHYDLLSSSRQIDHPFWDRDGIHEIVRSWRKIVDEYGQDRMMVAEAWVPRDRLPLYLRPDKYHQSFNFDLLAAEWDPIEFCEVIEVASKAAASVGSSPTWVLSNHDVMRATSRYGLAPDANWRTWPITGPASDLDPKLGLRRARAAALILLGLPGSSYIYQGEELGLPEVWDLPTDVLDDPVWERSGGEQKGRDGCRVPIPWSLSGPSSGFGDGPSWLPQPETWPSLSVEAQQDDEESTLNLFRQVISLRRKWAAVDEEITVVPLLASNVVSYRRGTGLTCIANMGTKPVALPKDANVLIASQSDALTGGKLAPDCAVWVHATS